MTKLSIIMGIYNTNNENMVSDAINSILSQTFKEFEFIICDDGSTDGTYELVKSITEHDKRVIVINNNRNLGLAASLNNCLSLANGEYIARMDADDISLPTRLEEQVQFLDANREYTIVGCVADLFHNNGVWGKREYKQNPVKHDFLFGTQFIHPTVMIRRKALEEIGGYRVTKETLRAEDYDLFMRLYEKQYKGYNLQKVLFQYREDEQAYKRRSYKYRLDEARVRLNGFKRLNLMPIGYVYVLKPLIIGLIPQGILAVLRNEKYRER